jgi:hypothetical protein
VNIYIMQINMLAYGVLEKRVNCWAHAIRLIDVQLCLIKDKEVRSCVRTDICWVQGLRMLEEWSKRRSPEFTNQMGIKINNPDYKIYQYKHKPCIETADWKQAFDWNSKRFKIFHIFKKQNMYMTCNCKELTREQCISHLDYLKKVDKETSFDDLITNTSFFKIILFNNVEWESSICSCFNWHKNLKCDHVISLATRLKLADLPVYISTPTALIYQNLSLTLSLSQNQH